MKKIYLLLILCAAFLASCNDEEKPDVVIEGTWTINRIENAQTGEVRLGAEIPYRTTYTFSADQTFTKMKIFVDRTLEATGSYSHLLPEANEQNVKYYLMLTFEPESELIERCGEEDFEIMLVQENGEMKHLISCDDSSAYYQKD